MSGPANIENTTFNYQIINFLAYPTYESYTDVVFSIMWEYTGSYTDDSGKVWTTSNNYNTPITVNNITDFIPFDQLTLQITIDWINQNVNINNIQQLFVDSINTQISPPPPSVVVLPPPF